jgi:RNA polymerase sigma factor (sigma-70 family)
MATIVNERVNVAQRDSFERLFQDEYARVVGIAYRVLGDAHAAEDVAQDVFYSFYRSHPADASYAAPWLYRAAAHTALNVIRGNKRRARREAAEAMGQERLQVTGAEAMDPSVQVERAEQAVEVQAALALLPQKSATVLALRYSGLSYAEVAATLGVGIGQIGTLLRRAEEALRKELTHETH